MHVTMVRTAVLIPGVNTNTGFSGCCRGMLAVPPQGAPPAAAGVPEGKEGAGHVSQRAFPGVQAGAGTGCGEGTSRAQGRGSAGGRYTDPESPSESE
jgi:hypothetical protein